MLKHTKESLDYRMASLENPSLLSILPYSDGAEREGAVAPAGKLQDPLNLLTPLGVHGRICGFYQQNRNTSAVTTLFPTP